MRKPMKPKKKTTQNIPSAVQRTGLSLDLTQ